MCLLGKRWRWVARSTYMQHDFKVLSQICNLHLWLPEAASQVPTDNSHASGTQATQKNGKTMMCRKSGYVVSSIFRNFSNLSKVNILQYPGYTFHSRSGKGLSLDGCCFQAGGTANSWRRSHNCTAPLSCLVGLFLAGSLPSPHPWGSSANYSISRLPCTTWRDEAGGCHAPLTCQEVVSCASIGLWRQRNKVWGESRITASTLLAQQGINTSAQQEQPDNS